MTGRAAPGRIEASAAWTLADTAQSIPERFEQVARRHGSTTAIAGTSWEPTFAELEAAANRLAHTVLERAGAGAARVALLMRHDSPLIAAALAVLRAGKTAVALNPGDPPARLARIRADTTPRLVITDASHRELALRAGFAPRDVVTVGKHPDCAPHAAPGVAVHPDDVAWLIYTSGSTGRPKGAMQTHRNMLHNVLRHTNGLGLRERDRISLLAAISGGQGVGTAWTALLNGATLCPFPTMERGVTGVAAWLHERQITVLIASASVFRHFARTLDRERFDAVRLLRLASEPAFRADFEAYRRHFADTCLLASTLSSSEAGAIAQCLLHADADPPRGRLPVGRAAEGIELLLLDPSGAEVAPGQIGEIVLRSDYLSPGYWGNAALTATRFSAGGSNGRERRFHTGDLGRISERGLLTVVGRDDSEVKVRGSRVELSDVEAALAARPEIACSAVCAGSTPSGDVNLTAYVSVRPGVEMTPGALRRELRSVLPDHAVPTGFRFLDGLPLDAQGGVDRERLASLDPASPRSGFSEPPASETEEVLANIWSEALEVERVGRDNDFFDLGGDSLTAAVIAAAVHGAFGVELELRAFVDSPTLAGLARVVDRLRSADDAESRPPLTRVPRADPLPASYDQQLMWWFSQIPEGSVAHTGAVAVRIEGPLDLSALRHSIDHLVARHEVLRTTFALRDGQLVQVVHPPGQVELPFVDLAAAPDPAADADELLVREAGIPFDLERGPLLRLRLLRLAENEHRLLRVNHHIVSDAWSWRLFFEQLGVVYEAFRRGAEPPLAGPSAQYGDFAAWERRWLHPGSPRYRAELEWWRRALSGGPPPTRLPLTRTVASDDAPPLEGVIWWGLPPDLSRRLDRLGREAGATYYMLRLALFAGQLAVECARDDVVLSTFVTRRRVAETQSMFGPLFNSATLRLSFTGEPSLREWLGRVRETVIETSAHTEVRHATLLDQLRAEGAAVPAPSAAFGESHGLPPLRASGLEITSLRPVMERMHHGFALWVNGRQEADGCRVTFDATVYEPSRVRAFLARFQRLAAEACADPDRPVRELVRAAARA